jgi:methionyl-tRNA formyltransferase
MKFKFVILGTSQFDIYSANAILDSGHQVSAMISMPENSLPDNSAKIEQYATQKNIPYHEILDINSPKSIEVLRQLEPDYIFTSWPKIVGKQVLDVPGFFFIGTHPTALPFNRGRHPLHWIIDLGIPETKLSFFKMDEGIDTGNIILQYPFQITDDDTIADVNSKMNSAAYEGTKILCQKFISEPNCSGEKQKHELTNYWRMRTPHDVTIDLRMPADLIMKIVRSFTLPFPCANLIFDNYVIKIKEVTLMKTEKYCEDLQRIEPGRIISIDCSKITAKAGDKIIELLSIDPLPKEMTKAKYIHPPSKYIMQHDIKFD